jgi:molybdopterin synthase sulfur carrier subunit
MRNEILAFIGGWMQIHIRLSGALASSIGTPRLTLILRDETTVAELRDLLCQKYPDSASNLHIAVPITIGRHVSLSEKLVDGQEVAFLMPIAGG